MQRDQRGSFTLSAWIKRFQTQWIFQRRIYVPADWNLTTAWEGYDGAYRTLVCWQLNEFGLHYRNRWDQRNFTRVQNSLQGMINSRPDDWHHLVLRKDSAVTTYQLGPNRVEQRAEELRFFV